MGATPPDVLIIDDDAELAAMLREYLERDGFRIRTAGDGNRGIDLLSQSPADLVILDVMLPGRQGFEILRELREQHPQLPVLMLTARGTAIDRILGLELGADDYLAKPFDPRELAARLRAVLRRTAASRGVPDDTAESAQLEHGTLTLQPELRRALHRGQPLNLTLAEFRVLWRLFDSPAVVVSRTDLTEFALGRRMSLYDRSIDTHVSNLRRKLVAAGEQSATIRAVRGAGYELLLLPADRAPS